MSEDFDSISFYKMVISKYVTFLFYIKLISCEETLERESRGIDSKGFATLIEIGRIIANFGVDNLQENVNNFFGFISKNIFVFYYLILGTILIHMITFTLILCAVSGKETTKETLNNQPSFSRHNSFDSHCTINLDTSDRDYWPAKETIV